MTTELWMLLASAVLMLLLPPVYGRGYIGALGVERMLGNREAMPQVEGWFSRAKRAHANLGENLVPFAAVVLVAHAAGVHSSWTRGAAVVFFVARLAHVAAYSAGVGVPRVLAYLTGLVATLVLAALVAF